MSNLPDYLFLIPLWWLGAELVGYIAHRLMHRWYVAAHEEHHMILYPPTDYYSKTYRQPLSGNSWKSNLWFGIPAVVGFAVIAKWLGWAHAGTFLATGLVTAFLNHYIHNSMHIINHWLGENWVTRRYFRWIQHRHFIHHVELHTNLGMYNYVWDTFGTSSTELQRGWEKNSLWAQRKRRMRK